MQQPGIDYLYYYLKLVNLVNMLPFWEVLCHVPFVGRLIFGKRSVKRTLLSIQLDIRTLMRKMDYGLRI